MQTDALIRIFTKDGVLRSRRIQEALRAVPRELFVPPALRDRAYEDTALPIGAGQTISQPRTVVFMLEFLAAGEGDIVLEVGYGSGWQSALLAYLVGAEGSVHAFEIVPELCAFGADNLAQFPELNARVITHCRSAGAGVAELSGRIDRIIAAAALEHVPAAWRKQLKIGGALVYPSGHSLWRETKKAEDKFVKEEFSGFVFVPYLP